MLDPPSPPQNVKIDNLTKKSCTVSWEPPANNGGSEIKGYYIERSTGYSSRFTKVNRDPISATTKSFNDLVEGTEYEFRVVAENEAGLSKPSETSGVFVAKDPFDKPGKPGKPVVKELNKDSATISWQPPEKDGGSPITNYIVEVKENGDKWKVKDDNVKDTTFTVSGLREGVAFEFRVTAVNKVGSGPPSAASESAKYGKYEHTLAKNYKLVVCYFNRIYFYLFNVSS